MKKYIYCYLLFSGFLFISCGDNNSAFIGKWYLIEGERGIMPLNFELLKNGTGLVFHNKIAWNVENNLLNITGLYDDFSFLYKITELRLELAYENEEKYVYTKKSGGSSDIPGTWKYINKQSEENFEYVFKKNGTLIVRYPSKEYRTNWMSTNETLHLFNENIIYKYSITGHTLTLTYDVYDPKNDNFEARIISFEKVR